METSDTKQVIGRDGLRGTVRSIPPSGSAEVELTTGQRVLLPVPLLQRQDDGSYRVPLGPADIPKVASPPEAASSSTVNAGQSVTVPVVQEQAQVSKEQRVSAQVVVRIVPEVRTEHLQMELAQEHVQIERVPVNEFVTEPRPVREEGDTTIIPVYEEVLVVQRRLLLREEVRIRRERTTRQEQQDVPLRTEEVHIHRSEEPRESPPAAGI